MTKFKPGDFVVAKPGQAKSHFSREFDVVDGQVYEVEDCRGNNLSLSLVGQRSVMADRFELARPGKPAQPADPTPKPHKWAKEIKAWADGAVIECRPGEGMAWSEAPSPEWDSSRQYRIKPAEPKVIWVNEYGDMRHAYADPETAVRAAAKIATRIAVKYIEAT